MIAQCGYAGKILRADLSSGSITHVPTMNYVDRFLGGRGIAAKVYWDEVSPNVKAFDPENRLIFAPGPLAGHIGIAGSRWVVCAKSPDTAPEQFCYSNLGGSWGAQLKFAGYDGIVIQGKSDKPVYLLIQNGTAEIREASHLWGKGAVKVRQILKGELGESVRVVASGAAGDNLVIFASLLADDDSSGSGGFGAVMGSKKLKAIAVRGTGKVAAANPERLGELAKYARELKRGTPLMLFMKRGPKMRKFICFSCVGGCNSAVEQREIFEAADGTKGKFLCASALFYDKLAMQYYGKWNEVPFYANRLCDDYGVGQGAIEAIIAWVARCNQAGLLTDESTGIPISKLGSLEFIETLIRKISLREGFGDILAQGLTRAADLVGGGANELIINCFTKSEESMEYDPRMFITTGLLYAMESRRPIQLLHELSMPLFKWVEWLNKMEGAYVSTDVLRGIAKKFLGSESAVDFSSYDGKALAAKKIQDREYAKESLVLCDFSWPIMFSENSDDHTGDPTIESKILSAVTGRTVDEDGLYKIGEVVFNLQRAVLAREGHRGRESDKLPEFCHKTPLETADFFNPEYLVPGKGGEIISGKGTVMDAEEFERMKDEYYQLRGWE